ncbi:hypothetical protein [Streptomyces sp. NPDC054794]
MGHHAGKPLQEFRAQSRDLAALVGALGTLLEAKSETEKGMTTLVKLTKQLDDGCEAEAKLPGEVSDAFDLLDVLIGAEARAKKG